jgi:lipopolysaccharide/colanic/teichoic acid biosynthesis glycosyltransferase
MKPWLLYGPFFLCFAHLVLSDPENPSPRMRVCQIETQSLEVHVQVNWTLEGMSDLDPFCFENLPREDDSSDPNDSYPLPSPWSVSRMKRLFDVVAVTATLPLVIPVLLAVGLLVRLSSRGPILFVQTRVGRHGRLFSIFKFRTMTHNNGENRPLITTLGNQPFTPVGRFLRKWKLDELPQILNVLRAEMSLVGPRPKVPDHACELPLCRPGITGAATLVFAREEVLLDSVPGHALDDYVHLVVLPAKRKIDAGYMSRATFLSDFAIIARSIFRRWNYFAAERVHQSAETDSCVADPSTAPRRKLTSIRTITADRAITVDE